MEPNRIKSIRQIASVQDLIVVCVGQTALLRRMILNAGFVTVLSVALSGCQGGVEPPVARESPQQLLPKEEQYSTAAVPGPLVGEIVFVNEGAEAKNGDSIVDINLVPLGTTVEEVKGDLLWIGRAWVHRRDVMSIQEAFDYFSDCIKQMPEEATFWGKRATVRSIQRDFDEAIVDFTEAIRLDSKEATYFSGRGAALEKKGEFARAMADYTEAIRCNPQFAFAYNNRGSLFEKNGEFDNAITDLTEAIRIDPQFAIAYENRANVWESKGDLEKAISDFTEAIKLNPAFAFAFNNRGIVWELKSEFAKAIKDYTEAIRLSPSFVNAYFNRGRSWRLMGNLDNAIKDYSDAIRLDPTSARSFANRGNCWDEKGDVDRARTDWEESIRLDPRQVTAYNSLASLLATGSDDRHRDGVKAVELAAKACELTDWNSWQCLWTLAAAHAESGDFKNAIKWQTRSIELAPAGAKREGSAVLELYRTNKPFRQAKTD